MLDIIYLDKEKTNMMIKFADIDRAKKTIIRDDVITFCRVRDPFGGLSNMSPGYKITAPIKSETPIEIRTNEHFYQSLRYPDHIDHQIDIINNPSPMGCKCTCRKYAADERPDWMDVNIQVLEWCATLKLLQHWDTFGNLLDSTGDKDIVEETNKYDFFWACRRTKEDENKLYGSNIFGQILMNIRKFYRENRYKDIITLEPMNIPNFRFLGEDIIETTYVLHHK